MEPVAIHTKQREVSNGEDAAAQEENDLLQVQIVFPVWRLLKYQYPLEYTIEP